ncbi:MAG: Maf family protein [Haliea sp.]|uniref:Maf family protein n=1 Tax=Haliea sp. TaxID=1932666 RepID=UPI0032EDA64F
MQALILASASPRRHELLTRLGVHFVVDAAAIDESVRSGEAALGYVTRMAREKAETVWSRRGDGAPVLAADTTVVMDDDILGKPADHFAGLAMLARLSGRTHSVITAVCLRSADGAAAVEVETRVTFLTLGREVCEHYLATPEPWDKAGGYGIQGLGGALVSSIEGSYSNVVGLPLAETWQLLARHGIATTLGSPDG